MLVFNGGPDGTRILPSTFDALSRHLKSLILFISGMVRNDQTDSLGTDLGPAKPLAPRANFSVTTNATTNTVPYTVRGLSITFWKSNT